MNFSNEEIMNMSIWISNDEIMYLVPKMYEETLSYLLQYGENTLTYYVDIFNLVKIKPIYKLEKI